MSRERIIKGKKEECVGSERSCTKGRKQRRVSKHEGKTSIGGRGEDRKQIVSGPKGFPKPYVLPTSLKEIPLSLLTPMEGREKNINFFILARNFVRGIRLRRNKWKKHLGFATHLWFQLHLT